jgi:RNA polymerase sigma-70 factor (ECF subfamily)
MKEKEAIFKEIISDYQDTMYRLCLSYVENKDKIQDLYQNILVRIWHGLENFKQQSSIKTWIYRIVINTGIDFLRTENKKILTNKFLNIDDTAIIDSVLNPEQKLIANENVDFIYHCINKMNFIEKTIISLYLEDLSYNEISAIVGISEKNVSVKLTRLKKKLLTCLKDIE